MYEQLQRRLQRAHQEHLLEFWEELSSTEKENFAVQLNEIDFEEIDRLFCKATTSSNENAEQLDMKPIEFDAQEATTSEELDTYRRVGLEAISQGHVGVLLLAGGQGSRLGVPYPKGLFNLGLPSGKSLLQIQAERIAALEKLTEQRGHITWYIMTSVSTEEAIKKIFEANQFFGLASKNVILFEQGVLPCFDMSGRMLLESKHDVVLSPDGNGGIYRALSENGILADIQKRDIRHLHVHSVDNVLVKVADPVFLGYCINKTAECGAKVVRKTNPSEAVGVLCKVNGRVHVVEYSEISNGTAAICDATGNLKFNTANICNHYFTVDFLSKIVNQHERDLKLHVVKKQIVCVKDKKVEGLKIEKFIFDAFQYCDKFATWEVPRDAEFSALKNSDEMGKDCPTTSRNALYRLHKKWIQAAGGTLIGDVVEVSPLVSYAGENLEAVVKGKTFHSPLLLN